MKRFPGPALSTKRSRITTATLASGAALASIVPWLLASCASTEADPPSLPDSSTLLDAAPVGDGGNGDANDECDASDNNCITKPVSCEEADWCPVPTNVDRLYALTSVWGSGKDDVWATGSGGTVIHWDGSAWTPTVLPSDTLPIKDTFRALWGSGPNDVWIASATNMIFHSTGFKDGTTSWERAPSSTGSGDDRRALFTAWGTSPTDVHFGGAPNSYTDPDTGEQVFTNQLVLDRSDEGITWLRSKGYATVSGLWGPSATELWLIGDNRPYGPQVAMVLHGTRQGGAAVDWTQVDSKATANLRGIWGSSGDDVWVVGDNGTIRHFRANATEAEVVESRTRMNLTAVWGSGPNDVWIIGDHGTILHFDGKTWSESVAALPMGRTKPSLFGIWGSGPDDVWIVGNDIALHHGPKQGGGTQ
jgi:hypothetical protein